MPSDHVHCAVLGGELQFRSLSSTTVPLTTEVSWLPLLRNLAYPTIASRELITYCDGTSLARSGDSFGTSFLKIVEILIGAAIPVVAILAGAGLAAKISGVLGSGIAALESILQFTSFDKNAQRWRTAAEALKREKWLFERRVGPYADPSTSEALFHERVENIASAEFQGWVDLWTKQTGEKGPHPPSDHSFEHSPKY